MKYSLCDPSLKVNTGVKIDFFAAAASCVDLEATIGLSAREVGKFVFVWNWSRRTVGDVTSCAMA